MRTLIIAALLLSFFSQTIAVAVPQYQFVVLVSTREGFSSCSGAPAFARGFRPYVAYECALPDRPSLRRTYITDGNFAVEYTKDFFESLGADNLENLTEPPTLTRRNSILTGVNVSDQGAPQDAAIFWGHNFYYSAGESFSRTPPATYPPAKYWLTTTSGRSTCLLRSEALDEILEERSNNGGQSCSLEHIVRVCTSFEDGLTRIIDVPGLVSNNGLMGVTPCVGGGGYSPSPVLDTSSTFEELDKVDVIRANYYFFGKKRSDGENGFYHMVQGDTPTFLYGSATGLVEFSRPTVVRDGDEIIRYAYSFKEASPTDAALAYGIATDSGVVSRSGSEYIELNSAIPPAMNLQNDILFVARKNAGVDDALFYREREGNLFLILQAGDLVPTFSSPIAKFSIGTRAVNDDRRIVFAVTLVDGTQAIVRGEPTAVDQCPSNNAKLVPGNCGCDKADWGIEGNTAQDCIDACPSNPNKTAPFGRCGCEVDDFNDTDKDGKFDCVDRVLEKFTSTQSFRYRSVQRSRVSGTATVSATLSGEFSRLRKAEVLLYLENRRTKKRTLATRYTLKGKRTSAMLNKVSGSKSLVYSRSSSARDFVFVLRLLTTDGDTKTELGKIRVKK